MRSTLACIQGSNYSSKTTGRESLCWGKEDDRRCERAILYIDNSGI